MCAPLLPDATGRARLETYLDMLQRWNKALNLTGMKDRSRIFSELVRDSFHLAGFLQCLDPDLFADNRLTVDMGSGAGLPAIPLRIVFSKGHCALVEVRQKRATFLENVLARLRLPRTRVHNLPVEKFFGAANGDFLIDNLRIGCIISRAFKPWPDLVQLARPFLPPDGCLIIMASHAAPPLPPPFQLLKQYAYQAAGSERWLWAIRSAPGGHSPE